MMNRQQLQALENKLRNDARQDMPAFSLPLHQRVMDSLRESGLPREIAVEKPRHARAWRIGFPLGIAAAVAVVAWMAVSRNGTIAPPPLRSIANSQPSKVRETPNEKVLPTADDISQAKYAYLDRDAQRFFMFVADQLPTLPDADK